MLQQLSEALRKRIHALQIKKNRELEQSFLVEGEKIVQELLYSDYEVGLVVVEKESEQQYKEIIRLAESKEIPVFACASRLFGTLCDAETPQGVIAVAMFPDLEDLDSSFVALDRVADPGNVGTIIRTCHWFGIRHVLLSEGCADCFAPKVVRSTMGSLFNVHIQRKVNIAAVCSSYKTTHLILGASVHATNELRTLTPHPMFGLIIGSESHGIAPEIENAISTFTIRGAGGAESLNAAIATGISLHHLSAINA